MMLAYRTPGVYFEWVDEAPPAIQPVRADITGFVGLAERGPLHTPTRIESMTQYTSIFGGFLPQAYLTYAVNGFFQNGGRSCYVVRVADPSEAAVGTLDIRRSGRPTLRVTASSPGGWSAELLVSATVGLGDRFSLTAQLPRTGEREFWPDLVWPVSQLNIDDPAVNAPRLRLNTRSRLVQLEFLRWPDLHPPGADVNLDSGRVRAWLCGGRDGLKSLVPVHMSGNGAPPDQRWGLATLEDVPDVSIVAMPDVRLPGFVVPRFTPPPPRDCADLDAPEPEAAPPQIVPDWPTPFSEADVGDLQLNLIGHCQRATNRIALLDPDPDFNPAQAEAWRGTLPPSGFAAVYYPWLRVPDPLKLQGIVRTVPPCGQVAGVYARVEWLVGVHKPPANEELQDTLDVERSIDDVTHGVLNDDDINVIRAYPGRGVRIAGARTLSDAIELRYVNVRRLLIMIERSFARFTQWIVFEPNQETLWADVERISRNFLDDLWRRGVLDGATAADAYHVECDAHTNPPSETEDGRLIAIIGIQPPWPAEFVVVRIGRTYAGTQILGATSG